MTTTYDPRHPRREDTRLFIAGMTTIAGETILSPTPRDIHRAHRADITASFYVIGHDASLEVWLFQTDLSWDEIGNVPLRDIPGMVDDYDNDRPFHSAFGFDYNGSWDDYKDHAYGITMGPLDDDALLNPF